MPLRDYQIKPHADIIEKLNKYNIAYLRGQMQIGKTYVALKVAETLNKQNVLFVTTKSAIPGVKSDLKIFFPKLNCTLINYESLHKVIKEYDFIIADEAHNLGKFPKPAKKSRILKTIAKYSQVLFLSGTPHPETRSQLYHQLYISKYSPFAKYKNFYAWAKDYVQVRKQYYNGVASNDYSNAIIEPIDNIMKKYFVNMERKKAGFKHYNSIDIIKYVDLDERIRRLVSIIQKDKFYEFSDGDILTCDTISKEFSAIHQLYSGTIKIDDKRKILVKDKCDFIKKNYINKRIAIFYKFIAEGDLLRSEFTYTDNPDEILPGRPFIAQMRAACQGIRLHKCDMIIFYNIDHSAVVYSQARDRLLHLHREKLPLIIWLFTRGGIEDKIYERVQNKQSYNNYFYRRDYGKETSKENYRLFK